MNFTGDYFSLGLVLVLFLFFLDSKYRIRHMSTASKLFVASLLMTAVSALTDLLTGYLLQKTDVPYVCQHYVLYHHIIGNDSAGVVFVP